MGVAQKEIDEASRASSEVLQKKYEEQLAAEEEATKKLEEETAKRIEQEKKEAEERKKIQEEYRRKREEALKIEDDARLALMDDMDRELLVRERKYQDDLKKLRDAGVDTAASEEAYQQDVLAIKKKYDDEKLKLEQDRLAKEKELRDKAAEEEKQRLADQAEKESQARQNQLAFLEADFNLRQQLGQLRFDEELSFFDKQRELQREELVATKATKEQLIAFDKDTAAARIQIERAQQETKLTIISDALGVIAEAVGKETKAGKALAISQALINTYLGATKALATYPPPFGAIAAATVVAAGLLQVNAIRKQKVPDIPKPGGGTVSGAGGGESSFVAPQLPTTSFQSPQIQTLPTGADATAQIAETIAGARQPIRAYVVSQDISSQQALDRRVNESATFG